jgi:hypothetical protein
MGANYVLLGEVTLAASAASVTLANIPQTGYTDLKIVTSLRDTNTGVANDNLISFNGSTASFTGKRLYGDGNSASSDSASRFAGSSTSSGATTSTFANTEIYIPNYTGSTNKSYSVDSVTENNATGGNSAYALLYAGLWSNTAAITSISIAAPSGYNFIAGSTVFLYGIAAVGTTPVIAPFASGGDIVTNDGTYWYHAFLSSGTFTVNKSLTADCLVVAGGGGGGDFYGSGGGGGGLLHFASQSLSVSSYACTVGAGGAAGVSSNGTVGADSQFGSLTLVKGGGYGAGGGSAGNGGPGGSGGGASGGSTTSSATGGTATSGQGNAGGNVTTSSAGSGGGGAGGTGFGAASNIGGAGGYGSSTYTTYGSVTGTGYLQSGTYYFAGGGAGAGTSGNGGQANGSTAVDTLGQANTGQGGGADGNSPYVAKAGGSGIVIIRYPIA